MDDHETSLFQSIRRINTLVDRNGLSPDDKEKILKALERINSVLGVMDLATQEVDREVESLIEKREDARKDRNWELADRLREDLKDMGIEIIDTKEGPLLRRIKR